MLLLLLLSAIFVMLLVINRQIALNVQCVVEKAVVDDISILAQFNAKPTFLACKALLWLYKFLYNTKSNKVTLGGGVSTPVITSFCDSDWSGCVNTIAAQSSAEAEFVAKSPCCHNSNFL